MFLRTSILPHIREGQYLQCFHQTVYDRSEVRSLLLSEKLLTVVFAVLRDDREYVSDIDELIRSREKEDGQREDLTFEVKKEDERFD